MRSSSAGNPSRSEGLPHPSAGAHPPAALQRSNTGKAPNNSELRDRPTDMDSQQVFTLGQQGLMLMLMVAAPVLLTVLVVGLVVSVLQAATQINEATLSFVPKVLAAVAMLAVAGPWMLTTLVEYIQRTLQSIPSAIG
jgi:flagellar biosynthetic protein FliQ